MLPDCSLQNTDKPLFYLSFAEKAKHGLFDPWRPALSWFAGFISRTFQNASWPGSGLFHWGCFHTWHSSSCAWHASLPDYSCLPFKSQLTCQLLQEAFWNPLPTSPHGLCAPVAHCGIVILTHSIIIQLCCVVAKVYTPASLTNAGGGRASAPVGIMSGFVFIVFHLWHNIMPPPPFCSFGHGPGHSLRNVMAKNVLQKGPFRRDWICGFFFSLPPSPSKV